jgi:molecular chaperone GrpE
MTDHTALPEEHVPSPEETVDSLLPPDIAAPEAPRGAQLEVEPSAEDLGLELPEDADEAQALLLRELTEARQESGEYLETLQRLAADFDNYRKRVDRDHAENVHRASQRVIESLLPALDSLDAALAYEPQTPGEEKMLDGMRGTHAQLLEILAAEGFEPIAALGLPFDPAIHEAVTVLGEGDGELIITQELRKGYVMRDRLIRPSLVIVDHA